MTRYLSIAFAAFSIFLISLFGYALTVGPNDIQKNAVRSKHIKKKSVKTSDIANGAVTAKKLDPSLLKGLGKIAYVAKSGGDYRSPVKAMNKLVDWCGTPSASNRCLMYIAPGTYYLGDKQIVMQEYVSIQGSGQEVTYITSAVVGGFNSTSAVIVGANRAALTDIAVSNTGNGTNNFAIFNDNASPRIERVTATASGRAWDPNSIGVLAPELVAAPGRQVKGHASYEASLNLRNLPQSAKAGNLYACAVRRN